MNEHTNHDEVRTGVTELLRDLRRRNLLDWSDDKIQAVMTRTIEEPPSPEVVLHTMRCAGLDDELIGQALPNLMVDAEVGAFAESIDSAHIPLPVELLRIELTETMRAVEDSSLWLEASDPEACRADMIRLAGVKFRAWVQAVS